MNRIKRDELLKWRQKQVGQLELDYEKSLKQVGEAHRAAERENAKQHLIDEQKEKNRQMALKRGKIAAQKIKDNGKPKPNETNKQKQVRIAKKMESSPESMSSDTSSTSTSSSPSSSDSSVSSVILVEKKKTTNIKAKDEIPIKMQISPKRPSTAAKSSVKKNQYNPLRFASANNSTATDISITDSPMSDPPPMITKVSELLGRKTGKSYTALQSSSHIAKTYKLNKSPVTSRTTAKRSIQTKPQINTVSTRLSRVIKTPTKSSGKSPLKVLPERKHFVPEFVKPKPAMKTAFRSDSAVQTMPQHSSTVQFYDHANRFTRQYEGNIDLHEHVQNITPLNAWDEAKLDIEADKMKGAELLNMRYVTNACAVVSVPCS